MNVRVACLLTIGLMLPLTGQAEVPPPSGNGPVSPPIRLVSDMTKSPLVNGVTRLHGLRGIPPEPSQFEAPSGDGRLWLSEDGRFCLLVEHTLPELIDSRNTEHATLGTLPWYPGPAALQGGVGYADMVHGHSTVSSAGDVDGHPPYGRFPHHCMPSRLRLEWPLTGSRGRSGKTGPDMIGLESYAMAQTVQPVFNEPSGSSGIGIDIESRGCPHSSHPHS